MDEFTSALFLPHTNVRAFPSVEERLRKTNKTDVLLAATGN
jgi:hypothetical protein